MCRVCKLPPSTLQNNGLPPAKELEKESYAAKRVGHNNLLAFIKLDYSCTICKPFPNDEIQCWQVIENDISIPC